MWPFRNDRPGPARCGAPDPAPFSCVLLPASPSMGQEAAMPEMTDRNPDDVRAMVSEHYASLARGGRTGCAPGCCGTAGAAAATLGYTADQSRSVPDGADLGLGCGNPAAIAGLRDGETV